MPLLCCCSLWNVKSPDQKLSAVVLNWKENNEDKQFLEVINIIISL